MLLTFEGNNIGPFRDDFELDMQPDRHVTDMDWCVLSEPCEKNMDMDLIRCRLCQSRRCMARMRPENHRYSARLP